MKILYDHQIFSVQKYGGISRYFFELIRHLPEEIVFDLPLLISRNHYLSHKEISGHMEFFQNYSFKGQIRIMKTINGLNSIRSLSFSKYDLFHPTYYSPYFLKYIGNIPWVITCYDLTLDRLYGRFPQMSTDKESLKYKKQLIEKSSKVIAISESTKRDIMECYGIPEKKIEVIYLASSFNQPFRHERIVREDYFLFVGSRSSHKNFLFFLESVSDALEENPELLLICAGGGAFNEEERALIEKLKLVNQVRQIPAGDEDVANLYSNALFFAFPSLYEGFGIPVLESFSCGCPALLSNTSSLPEVGGDAAMYFDPEERESINEVVRKVLGSAEIREQMTIKGYQQLKKFSWEKTAVQTVELYKSIV